MDPNLTPDGNLSEDSLRRLAARIENIKKNPEFKKGSNPLEEGVLFAEARKYDDFILELASYHSTAGLTQPADPQAILDCFKEFKMMVMRNEATVGELEKMVIGRFSLLGFLPEADRKIIGFSRDDSVDVK